MVHESPRFTDDDLLGLAREALGETPLMYEDRRDLDARDFEAIVARIRRRMRWARRTGIWNGFLFLGLGIMQLLNRDTTGATLGSTGIPEAMMELLTGIVFLASAVLGAAMNGFFYARDKGTCEWLERLAERASSESGASK